MTGGSDVDGPVVLVANPSKVDVDEVVATVARHCRARGLPDPVVLTTTEQDPGTGMAQEALRLGAGVVLAAGGDGTVRAVAQGLAGSDVPLAVIPAGTGNLLARNLDLPDDPETAVRSALDGPRRRLDVGVLTPLGGPDRRPANGSGTDGETGKEPSTFAVMAGIGLDAAMMADTPEGLKARVGWPAYLVGVVRALRRPAMTVELTVDDGPPRRQRVRMVLVGNVGRLQAGVELMPDARPDDGRLDLCVLAPRGVGGWLRALTSTVSGSPARRFGEPVQVIPVRRLTVRSTRPRPCQLDGDPIGDRSAFTIEVLPGALLICGQAPAASAATPTDAGDARTKELR
jgi:diacylglycerol kinase (ATP)